MILENKDLPDPSIRSGFCQKTGQAFFSRFSQTFFLVIFYLKDVFIMLRYKLELWSSFNNLEGKFIMKPESNRAVQVNRGQIDMEKILKDCFIMSLMLRGIGYENSLWPVASNEDWSLKKRTHFNVRINLCKVLIKTDRIVDARDFDINQVI